VNEDRDGEEVTTDLRDGFSIGWLPFPKTEQRIFVHSVGEQEGESSEEEEGRQRGAVEKCEEEILQAIRITLRQHPLCALPSGIHLCLSEIQEGKGRGVSLQEVREVAQTNENGEVLSDENVLNCLESLRRKEGMAVDPKDKKGAVDATSNYEFEKNGRLEIAISVMDLQADIERQVG
jgi:hypothetical protein